MFILTEFQKIINSILGVNNLTWVINESRVFKSHIGKNTLQIEGIRVQLSREDLVF